MKIRILLTVALLTTICSACSSAVNSEYLKQAQADALSRVAVKYAQVGQKDKAEQLLAQSLQSAKAIESFDTQNIVLSDVATTPFPSEDYLFSGGLKSDRKYFRFGEN